jgi:hypothetical protein
MAHQRVTPRIARRTKIRKALFMTPTHRSVERPEHQFGSPPRSLQWFINCPFVVSAFAL